MEFKEFEGMTKSELSLIEVAKAVLKSNGVGNVMSFADLKQAVQDYLELGDEALDEVLPQFYTDLNIDGSFISLGDNRWGLREWYPVDSIDEEVSHLEDDAPRPKSNKKKVNVFMDNDENAIDYSNDDPEDTDELYDGDNSEDSISAYSKDLDEINDKDGTVEEELTVVDQEHLEKDDEEYL